MVDRHKAANVLAVKTSKCRGLGMQSAMAKDAYLRQYYEPSERVHVSINGRGSMLPNRETVLGCPPSKGVGAQHQCSRKKKKGKKVDESSMPRTQRVQS